MLKVSLRNLVAHKGRLLLTAIAVVLGVAFMSGSLVLGDTLDRTFTDLFADVNEGTDAFVRAESDIEVFGQTARGRVDDAVLQSVRTVDGVAAAEGFVQGVATILDRDGEPLNGGGGPPAFGFSWDANPELNPFRIAEGRPPETPTEVVIDRRSADRGDFAVGDTVTVVTNQPPQDFTVVGIATFGTADSPAGASVVSFEPATAQALVAEPGKWDGIGVVATEGLSQTALVERIRPTLPSGVEVLTGEEITEENQNAIAQSLGFFNTFLLIFALIALAVGSFTIYNTFSILVAQRSQEIALVRAVGASRRQVLAGVLAEAFVVGLVSAVVGLVAGIALAAGLKSLLAGFGLDLPSGGLVVQAQTVVVAVVAGVLVTVLSAFFPARRASKVPPVAAMREVAIDRSSTSVVRLVLGVAVLALGAAGLVFGLGQEELQLVGAGAAGTFLGLVILGPVIARPLSHLIGAPLPALKGITGRLAVQNTTRNPKRTAATASAIMIGLGLIMFITIFADSAKASINSIVDENFRGDFVLNSGGGFGPTSGIPTQLAQDIAEVDGISAVTNLRFGLANIDGGGDFVIGIDPVTGLELFDIGVIEGSAAELGAGTIAVDDDRMAERGWVLGDTISFQSPNATEASQLRIAMVYTEDRLANRYVLPLVEFDTQFPNSLDAQIYAKVADGADLEQVRLELEELVAPYGTVELLDRTEFKAEQAAQINQFLNIIYALLALAVIIAFFGIANTLALSIIERRREIGISRAVGMTRGQLKSTIRWESVIIALMGTALGLAVGIFFSWAIVRALDDQGFTIYRIPVTQLVVWSVVSCALAVAMAWLPARRAAKTDVLEAIATE